MNRHEHAGLAYTRDYTGEPSLRLAMRHDNGFWDLPTAHSIEKSALDIGSVRRPSSSDGPPLTIYEIGTSHIPDSPENPFIWVARGDLEAISGDSGSYPADIVEYTSSNIVAGAAPGGANAPGISCEYWSLMVIKPDAKERGIDAEILGALGELGLRAVASTDNALMTPADVQDLWPLPPGAKQEDHLRDWWQATIDYMCSGPTSFHLLYGKSATAHAHEFKRDLRQRYGCSSQPDRPINQRVKSLIHTSETTQELLQNATLKWKPEQIMEIARGCNNAREQ